MLKLKDKNIGNVNLIGTFLILMFVAFIVILLSVNSKMDHFEELQTEIKMKFLDDKKNDIKFKINNLNILINNQDQKDIEKSQKFIKEFVKEINKSKHYVITIREFSKELPFYEELEKQGEYLKYTKHIDEETQKEQRTIEYSVLNKTWNWVISTNLEVNIVDEEIETWEQHLNDLIRDNIYVHISLLFLFSIALLLVTYSINKFSNKTISKFRDTIKQREQELKVKINKLEIRLEEEEYRYKEQTKLMQKQCKMLALGEMLGNLSHQWSLPLKEISNTATSIKEKIETHMIATNEDIEKLTHINNSSLYLARTVEDFRDFLKADSLKIDFSVNEIVEKSLSINESILEKNKIKIIKEYDENIMIHNLSYGLLQALVNIVYNSIDALRKLNEEDRYVFISTTNHVDNIEITITDTGNGIPEDIIKDIFKPYFTTKQKTYGTGLGLHMAYNIIVQNMSGRISVDNKKFTYKNTHYTGASFSIYIDKNEQIEG